MSEGGETFQVSAKRRLRQRHFDEEKLRARVPRVEQTSGTETDTAKWTHPTPTKIWGNLFFGVPY
ncbi:hypothetical protein [Brunnivagina elsteri]|uniref:Uncharacterized protein n=1 Tax=Brunnivagina elsteri CCALA 953 TaxID=987040 RepID=A0A2A2TC25_9CYAN|nr:hypothetical protein [Calothrix elsteri]PAX51208.1 hypothetical protein CK510_26040 [Calothrix elsteri CCALA 953]